MSLSPCSAARQKNIILAVSLHMYVAAVSLSPCSAVRKSSEPGALRRNAVHVTQNKKRVPLFKNKGARLYVSGFHRLNLGACFGGDAIDPACGRFQHVFGSVIRGKGIANRALVGQLSPIAAMDCEQARGKINVSVLGLFTSWPDEEPEAIAALTVRETIAAKRLRASKGAGR